MRKHSLGSALRIVLGTVAAGAALLVLSPPLPFPLTLAEARWLSGAPGFAAPLADAWIGAIEGDLAMRLPVIGLALAAVCAAVFAASRGGDRFFPLLAGLAVAAQGAVLGGVHLLGSPYPFALVVAAVCLVLIAGAWSDRARIGAALIFGLAFLLLEPGLAAAPFGIAAGLVVSRWRPMGRISRWAPVLLIVLVAALFALGRDLPWAGASGGRGAARIEQALLLLAATVLLAAAWSAATAIARARSGTAAIDRTGSETAAIDQAASGTTAIDQAGSGTTAIDRSGSGAAAPSDRGPGAGARRPGDLLAATAALALPALWLCAPWKSPVSDPAGTVLLLLAPAIAIMAAPALRPGALAISAGILMAALPLLAWSLGRERPPSPLPIGEAMAALKKANPQVRQLMPGIGITRGVLRHAVRGSGFEVRAPEGGASLGAIGLASGAVERRGGRPRSAPPGDTILSGYGLVGSGAAALRWAIYAPVEVRLSDGASRPDIALITVDTLRADHLSLYGYSRETSPYLRRWSERATVYERAIAPAPSTAPSFSSVMTGRLPVSHGVRKNYERLDPGNWTLARILGRAGYQSAAFVSSYVMTAENCGLDLGFDLYDEHLDQLERNRKDRPIRLGPDLARAVVSWVRARPAGGKPWFLWVHAIDPHGPYTPLPEFAGAFASSPPGALQPAGALTRETIPEYQWLGTTDFATYADAYDAEVLQTDRSLGEILDAIEAARTDRGIVVIFLADHGEALGEHGVIFDHGRSLHVEELHVPLLVLDSEAPAGKRVPEVVSTLDVAPMLLERLGIAIGLPMDGIPLEERVRTGVPVPSIWTPGEASLTGAVWKVMTKPGPLGAAVRRLYDFRSDPRETSPSEAPSFGEEAGDGAIAPLARELAALVLRDPLTPQLGVEIDREQWRALDEDAREKLRSLGYAAP